MKCLHCGGESPEQSTFCCRCGRRLLQPKETQVLDFEKLLGDGYTALDAGRTGEALLAAEAILRCDPANTSALALKSFVHERTGDLDQAIDAMEQVVTLNPESTPDRRRLMELRTRRGYPAKPVPVSGVPPVASPILAAGLTAIVFLVVALAFTLLVLRERPDPVQAHETEGSTAPATVADRYVQTPTGTPATPQVPGPYYRWEPTQQPQNDRNRVGSVSESPSAPTGALLPPIAPIVTTAPERSADSDTTPSTPEERSAVMPPPPTESRPSSPRSIIEVSVKPPSETGSAPGPPQDQESLNYLKIAQAQQQQGEYAKAIVTYQKALPGARYPGRIHQAIGLCHYRLGQLREAAAAYEQAIQAYDAQIRAGYDVNGAQAGIAACRAGLRACRAGG